MKTTDDGFIELETAPLDSDDLAAKDILYPGDGIRVALDPNHGMMPARIEYYNRDGVVSDSIRITKFLEVEPGIFAPLNAMIELRQSTETIRVDAAKSVWNKPNPELFKLGPGTRIFAKIEN